MNTLRTTDEVIDALGGNGAVSALTARGATAVSNWRSKARGKFPPETYLVIQQALAEKGLSAPPALWSMVESPLTDEAA